MKLFSLTWFVRLRNRCELQLRNWYQGREWNLMIPKRHRRLWHRLRYICIIKDIVSHLLKIVLFELTSPQGWFLDELQWPWRAMARSQRTLHHKQQELDHRQWNFKKELWAPTELHRATVTSWCYWYKVRVCSTIGCCSRYVNTKKVQSESWKDKKRTDVPPQDQLIVVLGLQ